MKVIKQIRIQNNLSVKKLAEEFERSGVLGAGRFSKTSKILKKMFSDSKFFNILALSGPLVPAGLRLICRDLIQAKLVNCIVTTGANMTHDIIEALGVRHLIGNKDSDDEILRKKNIGRIYDIFIEGKAFEKLEKSIYALLDTIPENERENLSTYKFFNFVGSKLHDTRSIITTAYKMKAPILSPGIYDSMLGINLWTYSQLKKLIINPFLDFSKIVELCCEAQKVGIIILGGGLPKHYSLVANIFRGGIDAAIQVTSDRPESGGLSGAPLEEAISWGKIVNNKNIATLIGDASLLFPMLIASVVDEEIRD